MYLSKTREFSLEVHSIHHQIHIISFHLSKNNLDIDNNQPEIYSWITQVLLFQSLLRITNYFTICHGLEMNDIIGPFKEITSHIDYHNLRYYFYSHCHLHGYIYQDFLYFDFSINFLIQLNINNFHLILETFKTIQQNILYITYYIKFPSHSRNVYNDSTKHYSFNKQRNFILSTHS